ncbi:MAG: STT3 domain-containing protein, partial [Candidatus Bathyarchaeia archaeon]
YVVSLLALFTFVLILLKRSSPRLLMTYGVTFGLGFIFMAQIPRLGYVFFQEWITAVIAGVFILLLVVEGAKKVRSVKGRLAALGIVTVFLLFTGATLWRMGLIAGSAGKFLTILDPTARFRMPLVESVAEHRPATWASFFLEFGVFITLGLFGLYFATRRQRESDVFLVLLGATSAYFASSFVRLTLLMAPAFAVLAGIAVAELGKPAIDVLKETVIFPKKKIRMPSRVGKEFGASIVLILIIITMPTFYYSIKSAYAPTTIATSSIPVAPTDREATKYQDWIQALAWMKANLPEDAVIFSWWDYGYWITAIADKNSLADNGTINSTQIAVIACTFLTTENRSVPILKRYRVSEVAIFATWTKDEKGALRYYGYGEDNKWYWMARIGNGTVVNGERYNFYQRQRGEETIYLRTITVDGRVVSNETIADNTGINKNTMLGKLIQAGINPDMETSDYFKNSFSSKNRFVFLWNVQYLNGSRIELTLDKPSVTYGEQVRIQGTLQGAEGEPLRGREVLIEYSRDLGDSWEELTGVTTEEDGAFRISTDFNVGGYLIRARWDGEPGQYVKATSDSKSLNVTPGKASLEVTAPPKLLAGQQANLTAKLSARVNSGNMTIQYSEDQVEWRIIRSSQPVNGTLTATWTPDQAGEFYIRATWSGDFNYDPSVSEVVKLIVE